MLAGDRLLLNGDGLHCVSPADGKLLWKRPAPGYTRFSVGNDFLVMRGYGGHGVKIRLDDGKDYPNCKELGGATHACSSVALTPQLRLRHHRRRPERARRQDRRAAVAIARLRPARLRQPGAGQRPRLLAQRRQRHDLLLGAGLITEITKAWRLTPIMPKRGSTWRR